MPSETLSTADAGRVYDRIGRLQDWQSFYEGPAISELIEHGDFASAMSVYEFGCGTGALARRLFEDHLGPGGTYHAVDISKTMMRLASERLDPWTDRSRATTVAGGFPLPGEDHGYDRFVATYVFDLLDEPYARAVLDEARRLLTPEGKLCLVSLTQGATPASRTMCRGWMWVWSRSPKMTGGCRPVDLRPLLAPGWDVLHRRVLTAWAITSEVIVATPAARAAKEDDGEQ